MAEQTSQELYAIGKTRFILVVSRSQTNIYNNGLSLHFGGFASHFALSLLLNSWNRNELEIERPSVLSC